MPFVLPFRGNRTYGCVFVTCYRVERSDATYGVTRAGRVVSGTTAPGFPPPSQCLAFVIYKALRPRVQRLRCLPSGYGTDTAATQVPSTHGCTGRLWGRIASRSPVCVEWCDSWGMGLSRMMTGIGSTLSGLFVSLEMVNCPASTVNCETLPGASVPPGQAASLPPVLLHGVEGLQVAVSRGSLQAVWPSITGKRRVRLPPTASCLAALCRQRLLGSYSGATVWLSL